MPLRRFVAVLAVFLLLGMSAAGAQDPELPEGIEGEVIIVPVVAPGEIAVDGDLEDWVEFGAVITNDGPGPSDDPALRGQLRWQIAASEQSLYVAATITDDLIVAGENGDDYWNEDSVEVYLNFGDLEATEYGPGVAQITMTPVDRGNTDPNALTLAGISASDFETSGFVFDTEAGWGFELEIGLAGVIDVSDGAEFGLQMQANGSSGADRDMKIIWSSADTDDTSFRDPSVFGTGVFLARPTDDAASVSTPDDAVADDLVAGRADAEDADADSAVVEDTAPIDAPEVDAVGEVERPDTEPEEGRTLLFAAIFSAVTILLGGLYVERRRKRSEAEHAARGASRTDKQEPTDEEFDAMVTSILDEQ